MCKSAGLREDHKSSPTLDAPTKRKRDSCHDVSLGPRWNLPLSHTRRAAKRPPRFCSSATTSQSCHGIAKVETAELRKTLARTRIHADLTPHEGSMQTDKRCPSFLDVFETDVFDLSTTCNDSDYSSFSAANSLCDELGMELEISDLMNLAEAPGTHSITSDATTENEHKVCKGIKANGCPCNYPANGSGYCGYHRKQAATTQAGAIERAEKGLPTQPELTDRNQDESCTQQKTSYFRPAPPLTNLQLLHAHVSFVANLQDVLC